MPSSMAAKEKTSWLMAWLAPILLLLAALPASALTARTTETRAWEKTSSPLESRRLESLQLLNLHQQNTSAGYDYALGSPLAAESAGPIQAGEVTTYQDFVDRSVVGDDLEGHELWQNANLKAQGLAPTRLSTLASQDNPVIALDSATHAQITYAQQVIDAASQTPIENINTNATLLRLLDAAPEDAVNQLQQLATQHAQGYGY
jgi:hypothetical protein